MAEPVFIEDREELCELAPVACAPLQHHIFVCTGKSCSAVGSAEVREAFEEELKARGMLFGKAKKGKNPRGSIIVTECASVGFCAVGAAVMIYPEGVWYAQVRAADVGTVSTVSDLRWRKCKPLKPFRKFILGVITRLKPGVNEMRRLQVRPVAPRASSLRAHEFIVRLRRIGERSDDRSREIARSPEAGA